MSASQQTASGNEVGFTIEPVFGLTSCRVMHPSSPSHSLAILDVESDGTLTLFPTAWGDLPAPLTGEIAKFATLSEVESFLGIQRERIAA